MRRTRRFVPGALIALSAALAVLVPASPASAGNPGAVDAAVLGYTLASAPPITTIGTNSGSFDGITLAGAFSESEVAVGVPPTALVAKCLATVSAGGVTFNENPSHLAAGAGTLGSAGFSGGGDNCTVSGSVTGGTFARAGNVAVAAVGLDYNVTEGTVNPAGSATGTAVAVVTATPGAVDTSINPACGLGNPSCALVAGNVAGVMAGV